MELNYNLKRNISFVSFTTNSGRDISMGKKTTPSNNTVFNFSSDAQLLAFEGTETASNLFQSIGFVRVVTNCNNGRTYPLRFNASESQKMVVIVALLIGGILLFLVTGVSCYLKTQRG